MVKVVRRSFAKKIIDKHLIGEHTNNALVMVYYKEKVGIGAQKGSQSLIKRIIVAYIANFGVDDVLDVASFFDFEIIERSGVD